MKNNRINFSFIILIQLMTITNSFAQLELKGVVVDEKNNDPLPGVNIIEENTENIAYTDFNGKFRIIVSDTATIQISYIGYLDKIIKAAKYQGDTIRLRENPNITITDCFPVYNYNFIGYFGDLNKNPYGFSFLHNLFPSDTGLSGQINYKTNLKSNYDIKLFLIKNNLIDNLFKYRLSAVMSFQKRKYKKQNVNDYELILNNHFWKKFNFLLGYTIKINFTENQEQNNGVLIGINKNFDNTLTYISSNLKIFKNFSEYNFTILQGVSKKKKFWNNLKIGVEYKHYQDNSEYNLIVRYGFYSKLQ